MGNKNEVCWIRDRFNSGEITDIQRYPDATPEASYGVDATPAKWGSGWLQNAEFVLEMRFLCCDPPLGFQASANS